MSGRATERAMRLASVALAVVAMLRWREGSAALHTDASPSATRKSPGIVAPSPLSPDRARQAVETIIDGDLFRRDRHAAEAPLAAVVPPIVSSPPKPRLVLRGLVGGPPWDAVLDGIPGRNGPVLVRVGDTLAGLVVRRMRHDTLVVHGADTTWKLTMARP
jgi:hypothetical protein